MGVFLFLKSALFHGRLVAGEESAPYQSAAEADGEAAGADMDAVVGGTLRNRAELIATCLWQTIPFFSSTQQPRHPLTKSIMQPCQKTTSIQSGILNKPDYQLNWPHTVLGPRQLN